MNKRSRRHLIAVVLCVFGGVLGGPAEGEAAEKVILGVDWQILGQHTPFFTALDKGFYQSAGLDVEIVRGYGSADAVKRVAAKTVTFSLGDMGALVIGRSEGIPVKMVAVVYGKAPYTVLTRRDAGIQAPKDLEGKTLGAPAGSATRALFPVFAKLANVDADKVKWTTGDSTTLWNLFFARRVDGLPTFIVNKPDLDKSAREAGFEIVSMMYSDYGLVAYSNGILARDEMIKSNPSLVRTFVKASLKGLEHAFKNPDESTKILLKYRKELDFAAAKQQLAEFEKLASTEEASKHGLGYMAHDKVERTRDLMADVYKLKVRVPTEELYTNEFLE
jgi:NitT/TauT family transport system substrate-binding protein